MGSLRSMFIRAIAGKRPDDLVFQTQTYETCQNKLKAAAAAVGCDSPGFGWHALRRCHNTWLRRCGATAADAMQQMGHTTTAVNDLYLVAESEDFARRERLVAELQGRIIGQVGAKAN